MLRKLDIALFGSNDCWKHDKTVSYGFLCVKIIFALGNNKFMRGKQTVWNGNLSINIFAFLLSQFFFKILK